MIPTWSSTAAIAHITYPPASLLDIFPPPSEPAALYPPQSDHTFSRPFDINPTLYNDLLKVEWPLTIATVYAITAFLLNQANKRRENQPWAIAKSSVFYLFILLHNLFLAAFSLWTFVGMAHAFHQSWPGFEGEHKWATAADALCKINGPRGLGSAATFNSTTSDWRFTDSAMKLLNGLPDNTDVGRIWNEGLGFYGWLFYVSKFYEIVDTLILLAKGKNSSMLQTFHHAGAMMCMWAGIRYMSPPIWMFVFVNSGLHGLMYIYYALATLGIQVPIAIKRVLTALQITQFVFGGSYAIAHLFIAYDIPVSVPYLFIHNLSSAMPSAASSVSSAVASATASAGLSSWLKKAALRAAGEEGLAMNVRNDQGQAFGVDAVHAAESEKSREEIRYRTDYQTISCLDTSGQTFAILLNILYLAPLTALFLQFFVNNYILGIKKNVPPATRAEVAKQSARDALDKLEQIIKQEYDDATHNDEIEQPEFKAKIDEAKLKLKIARSKCDDAVQNAKSKGQETALPAQERAEDIAEAVHKEAKELAEKATSELQRGLAAIKEKAQDLGAKVEQKGGELKEEAGKKAKEFKRETEDKAEDIKEKAEETVAETKDKTRNKANELEDEANGKVQAAEDTMGDFKNKETSSPSEEKSAQKPRGKDQKSKIPRRDKSPVKRDPSPVKADASQSGTDTKANGKGNDTSKDESKVPKETNGAGTDEKPLKDEGKSDTNGLDESAYEINPDELKDEAEMKAEAEMQPKVE